jgi:hypothetical protein
MESNIFRKSYKEKLDVSSVKSKPLEHTDFNLIGNCIYYFNCDGSESVLDCYLNTQLEILEKSFKSLGKRFIVANSQYTSDTDFEALQYYFPTLKNSGSNYNNCKVLLDYLNYSGNIQSGFIYYDYSTSLLYIIELPSTNSLKTFDLFFEGFYDHIKYENDFVNKHSDFLSPSCSPFFYEDEIDMNVEDSEAVKQIVDKLNAIKEKGSILSLLPVLDNHLKEQSNKDNRLSRLHIDHDYKIYLTDYQIEIKLSHLTKAIYFFFLVMKSGVHLTELSKYKTELFAIYLAVSNQDNYEKMKDSINLLVDDKRAIYVHLSRIKGTFHKVIDCRLAENYSIRGEKDEVKSISISRDLTNIYEFTEQWKIPSSVYQTQSKRSIDDNFYGQTL